MPRHINDSCPLSSLQIKISKTQVNGNPSAFFLCKPVRIPSGKCPDQSGLSMIDMACCADDYMLHIRIYPFFRMLPSRKTSAI